MSSLYRRIAKQKSHEEPGDMSKLIELADKFLHGDNRVSRKFLHGDNTDKKKLTQEQTTNRYESYKENSCADW